MSSQRRERPVAVRWPPGFLVQRGFEAEDHAVVKIVTEHQAAKEVQAVALGRPRCLGCFGVVLVMPRIEHRSVAEPMHAILFARAAQEGVVDTRTRHLVLGLRARQNDTAFFDEIRPIPVNHQRVQAVAQIVFNPAEIIMRVKVLAQAVGGIRRLNRPRGEEVSSVLLPHIETEKAITEFLLQQSQRLGRHPNLVRHTPRNISPHIEQVVATAFQFIERLAKIWIRDQINRRHANRSKALIGESGGGQRPQRDELRPAFEGGPSWSAAWTAGVVRVEGRIEQMRIDGWSRLYNWLRQAFSRKQQHGEEDSQRFHFSTGRLPPTRSRTRGSRA